MPSTPFPAAVVVVVGAAVVVVVGAAVPVGAAVLAAPVVVGAAVLVVDALMEFTMHMTTTAASTAVMYLDSIFEIFSLVTSTVFFC